MNHTWATLKKIGHYLLHQRAKLITVIILTIAAAGLTLAGPYLLGMALDDYIVAKQYEGLLQLCLLMLAVYAGGSLVGWLQAYFLAEVSQRTVWSLRKDLFSHVQKLPIPFFASRNHGELMSRTTNDIDNVTNTLNQSLIQIISSVIMLIGSFTMMLLLNGWLTLVALIVIPVIVFVSKKIAKVTKRQFKGQQQELGGLNSFIEETVSGQKVVALFHQEERMAEQFAAANAKLKKVGIKAQIYSGTMGPFMNMFGHISYLIIAGVGGWLAVHDQATVGVIISFLGYSRQFSGPLNEVANQYNLIQSGIAGAERVFEMMETPSEYEAEGKAAVMGTIAGKVEFRDVRFEYKDGTAALQNISFTAKPGETIALVGPTGAGKTTIINLIGRFFEIKSGQILIDNEDIREVDKNSLRSQLGIVLQDAHLFTGTIRENIRYGRLDATDEEVEAAALQANADSFIAKLPHGYDTELTAEGGNVSHGQRQLITIARAILGDPALLILDEATSSVDTLAELQIQEAMKKLLKGRTSFVIAHRLSTIRHANQILFIKDGQIAERGNHEELLARRGLYYELHGNTFLQNA
ncbi:ATP-binding cassette subfamily B protein [Paenibacillus endophyticus]|uniref:ATP-binding cassette subfamily B protein n=1 Tax=Paenibacillus endophyticus TaxID=1294268 RepID=A0A7W5CDX9_9BACL|nr:ABC transporter ATP-binding protein [Paenibacillus endophyticus]MBB3155089.1 ATP-binding cassette subfamily B protein [Paenibacillus endophyticus]